MLTTRLRSPVLRANVILLGAADLNRPGHSYRLDRLRKFRLPRIVQGIISLTLATTHLVIMAEAREITHPRLPRRETAMVPLLAARGILVTALPERRMTLRTMTTTVVTVAEVAVAVEAGVI